MGKQIRIHLFAFLIVIFSSTSVFALEPNQQTWFNSLTDSISTLGKNPQDKKDIIRLRQESRRQYRLQKEQIRKRAGTRKRIKQQQQSIKRKYNQGHTGIGL